MLYVVKSCKHPQSCSRLNEGKNIHGGYINPVYYLCTPSHSENNHTLFILGARHDVEGQVLIRSAAPWRQNLHCLLWGWGLTPAHREPTREHRTVANRAGISTHITRGLLGKSFFWRKQIHRGSKQLPVLLRREQQTAQIWYSWLFVHAMGGQRSVTEQYLVSVRENAWPTITGAVYL